MVHKTPVGSGRESQESQWSGHEKDLLFSQVIWELLKCTVPKEVCLIDLP
jgi:hypothetical protein